MLRYRDRTRGFYHWSTIQPLTFPAGEHHFTNLPQEPTQPSHAIWQPHPDTLDKELIELALWADTAQEKNENISLIMPYAPGARADRGTPFGARLYANLINAMGFHKVIILDPHSPVIVEHLNRVTVADRNTLIARATKDKGYTGIIAPDKGAIPRSTELAQHLNLPIYYAEKTRDFETGKLTGFTCPTLPENGKYLIADDICDGGGTFMGLAEATGLPKEQLGLWVTHGVFSGAAHNLTNHYGEILTTNSLESSSRIPEATVIDITAHLESELLKA